MTTTVTAKIQIRKGTAAAWTSANPTLLSGEIGYETDTGKQKVGDGVTAWTSLAYYYDPANVGITDHGGLSGLSDDDHSIYHTDARGDARYAVIAHAHTGTYEPAGAAASAVSSHEGAADPHTGYALESSLGGAALLSVGTTTGTVAAGDDARFATGTTGDAFASSHPGGNAHIDWTADQGATNLHAGNIPDLSGTYATAAQGGTADSAVQPGDDAADLGSGAATDGQVLTADGLGGAAWEAAAASGGDVTGPGSSTDNALARFHETGGKTLQNSVATLSDNGSLTLTGATVTTSQPILDVTQTWNDAAVEFTAINVNITDTASLSTAGATKLLDLKVGNTTMFAVDKLGRSISECIAVSGIVPLVSNGYISFGSFGGLGATPGYSTIVVGNALFKFRSDAAFGWTGNTQPVGTSAYTLSFYQDATNIFAQRRTTNPQTYRIYNTYTDASNYERLAFTWDSNVAKIQTEAAGTGTLRNLHLSGLPTADPNVSGVLWNSNNTVRVSTGAGVDPGTLAQLHAIALCF